VVGAVVDLLMGTRPFCTTRRRSYRRALALCRVPGPSRRSRNGTGHESGAPPSCTKARALAFFETDPTTPRTVRGRPGLVRVLDRGPHELPASDRVLGNPFTVAQASTILVDLTRREKLAKW
jgi:hypothetical protein